MGGGGRTTHHVKTSTSECASPPPSLGKCPSAARRISDRPEKWSSLPSNLPQHPASRHGDAASRCAVISRPGRGAADSRIETSAGVTARHRASPHSEAAAIYQCRHRFVAPRRQTSCPLWGGQRGRGQRVCMRENVCRHNSLAGKRAGRACVCVCLF